MEWKNNNVFDEDSLYNLTEDLCADNLIVRLFMNRFKSEDMARIYFKDTHEGIIPAELLTNAIEAAKRIVWHIKNDSFIQVYADYDCDGINSGVIFAGVINDIISRTSYRPIFNIKYPNRTDGYGLNMEYAQSMVYLHRASPSRGILVMTVDNGIAQIEQIQHMVDNGIEVIVTDHHESKDEIPNCLIVDPHNHHEDQGDTFKHLCGAGVIFKVCELVQKELFGESDMIRYYPNLTIATIADMMPLNIENLSFIRYGLFVMNTQEEEYLKYKSIGISQMCEFLGIKKLNPHDIAWKIGPRINACGRMGFTEVAVNLLEAEDSYIAEDIVNEIELINEDRKSITNNAMKQLEENAVNDKNIIIHELDNIPVGIVGIIAGRAIDMFNKPAIIVINTDGECHGSARSIPGLNLMPILQEEFEKGNILKFGGHAEAAGIRFEEHKIEDLKNNMHIKITEFMNNNDIVDVDNSLYIDAEITIDHLTEPWFDAVYELPYNKTNLPRPVFALCDCEITDFKEVASNKDNIWLTARQGRRTIKLWCRGMTERYKSLGCPKNVHLAGYIEKNFMEGHRPFTFEVIDIIGV